MPHESTWTTFLQKGGSELSARDARPSWLWQTYSIVQAVQNKHMYVWAAPVSSTTWKPAHPSLASVHILCGVSGLLVLLVRQPCVAQC